MGVPSIVILYITSKPFRTRLTRNFEGARDAATYWFHDEPFSSRPLRVITFVSIILGEAELAEKYALQGLSFSSDNVELRNNLVCALASQNKIDEALNHLQQIIQLERSQSKEISGHTIANFGMILYRAKRFIEAEDYYRKAMTIFNKDSNETKGLAIAFMAREALLAGAPNAQTLIAEAIDIVEKYKAKAGVKILNSINKLSLENNIA